ncbi:MAG: glycosyl hydrolase family 65 protein, partial [Pseudanabaenaceae cyanobacterium]
TGTAVWMLRIGVDGFLGLQPELAGLRLAPRLPAAWPEVRVQRRFRGKTLQVHIRPTATVSEFTVNGERVPGNLLRVNDFPGEVLTVTV